MQFFSGPDLASPGSLRLRTKLRVRIGPTIETLVAANVNNEDSPHYIDSPYFIGYIVVRVNNFHGYIPANCEQQSAATYFEGKKRSFSIQISGRFKQDYGCDDVVFGADFDSKCSPPTGTWIALKFAALIDPALTADAYAQKPWFLSPLVCSMNIVNVAKANLPIDVVFDTSSISSTDKYKSLNSAQLKPKNTELLCNPWIWKNANYLTESNTFITQLNTPPFAAEAVGDRRKYFQKQKNRESNKFIPENLYNFEIYAPFIDFNTFDLNLGINVNLIRYLSDQPIRLLCKTVSKNIPLFYVEFALCDEDGSTIELTSKEKDHIDNHASHIPSQIKHAEAELEMLTSVASTDRVSS